MRELNFCASGLVAFVALSCGIPNETTNVAATRPKDPKANLALDATSEDPFAQISETEIEAFDAEYESLFVQIPDDSSGFSLQEPIVSGSTSTTIPPVTSVTIGPATVSTGSGIVTVGGEICATNGNSSASGSVSVTLPFSGVVPYTEIARFGVREHIIFASASFQGDLNVALAGSISATPTSWSATLSANGTGSVIGTIFAKQHLWHIFPRPGQWREHNMGSATLSATARFSDSVTYTQSCNPAGATVTTQGGNNLAVNAAVLAVNFEGFFFPNAHGPVVTAIRRAISNWAVRWGNNQLPGLIAQQIGPAMATYDERKTELLRRLVGALPAGCGCNALPVLSTISGVLSPTAPAP